MIRRKKLILMALASSRAERWTGHTPGSFVSLSRKRDLHQRKEIFDERNSALEADVRRAWRSGGDC
jgi:hypothetical protein